MLKRDRIKVNERQFNAVVRVVQEELNKPGPTWGFRYLDWEHALAAK
jgi:hypothetical protein